MKNNLLEILKAKGWSQGLLARKAETDVTSINKIINQGVDIRLSTALKIAKALDMKVEEIWQEE